MAQQRADHTAEWPSTWPDRATIHRLALAIALGDDELAEALEGDLYIRLLTSVTPETRVNSTWIRRVLQNLRTDTFRARAARPAVYVDPDHLDLTICSPQSSDEALAEREACSHLLSAVDRLAPRQRDAIKRRYLDGMGAGAIATQDRVSVRSVQRDLKWGMVHLRRHLSEPRAKVSSLAVLLGGIEDVRLDPAAHVGTAATAQVAPILFAATVGLVAGVGLFALTSSSPPDPGVASDFVDPRGAKATEEPPTGPAEAPDAPASRVPVEEQGITSPAAGAPDVPDSARTTPPDDGGEDAAAPATRTFEIRLVVNGEPATAPYRALNPQLEPDAPDADTENAVVSFDHSGPDEDGRFRFELPEGDGEWLFQLAGTDLPGVYVQDDARGDLSIEVRFDTGAFVVENVVDTLDPMTTLAVTNVQPGVWVLAGARVSEDAPSTWTFPSIAAGAVDLRTFVGRQRVPDAWARSSRTWTVSAGGTTKVRFE